MDKFSYRRRSVSGSERFQDELDHPPIEPKVIEALLANNDFRHLMRTTIELKQGKLDCYIKIFQNDENIAKLVNKTYLSLLKPSTQTLFNLLLFLPKFLTDGNSEYKN